MIPTGAGAGHCDALNLGSRFQSTRVAVGVESREWKVGSSG